MMQLFHEWAWGNEKWAIAIFLALAVTSLAAAHLPRKANLAYEALAAICYVAALVVVFKLQFNGWFWLFDHFSGDTMEMDSSNPMFALWQTANLTIIYWWIRGDMKISDELFIDKEYKRV